MLLAGVLLFGGQGGGGPTTVTVVVAGEVRQAGLVGTIEGGLSGTIDDNRLSAVLSEDEFEAQLKDQLDGTVDDQNLDGEVK